MTTHYVLVEISTPGLDEGELAAEMISEILESDPLLYMIGSSGGPNPPYERHAEIISVTAETMV